MSQYDLKHSGGRVHHESWVTHRQIWISKRTASLYSQVNSSIQSPLPKVKVIFELSVLPEVTKVNHYRTSPSKIAQTTIVQVILLKQLLLVNAKDTWVSPQFPFITPAKCHQQSYMLYQFDLDDSHTYNWRKKNNSQCRVPYFHQNVLSFSFPMTHR